MENRPGDDPGAISDLGGSAAYIRRASSSSQEVTDLLTNVAGLRACLLHDVPRGLRKALLYRADRGLESLDQLLDVPVDELHTSTDVLTKATEPLVEVGLGESRKNLANLVTRSGKKLRELAGGVGEGLDEVLAGARKCLDQFVPAYLRTLDCQYAEADGHVCRVTGGPDDVVCDSFELTHVFLLRPIWWTCTCPWGQLLPVQTREAELAVPLGHQVRANYCSR